MKIIFVLQYYYPSVGGVEKLFKQLAEGLQSRGNTVRVITTRKSRNLPKREIINGVEIIRTSFSNRILFAFFGVFKVYKFSKGFDIIHTTTFNTGAIPAFIVSKLRNIKSVITINENWGNLWFKLPYLIMLERILFWFFEKIVLNLPFDYWVSVSNFTLESVRDKKNLIRIYNGITYSEIKKVNNYKYDFIHFGRLGVSKGLDLLIRATVLLKINNPNIKLLLVVPNNKNRIMRKIISIISENNLTDNIVFKHNLSQQKLEEYLTYSRSAIIPSYSEGFCFAAIESIAIGVPVISSGKGALEEVISGKYITFSPFNSESLHKSMEAALEGKWIHKSVKKFEIKKTVDQYLALYKKL
jgi:glycosyltransferase involved in cell wall biosynthesis